MDRVIVLDSDNRNFSEHFQGIAFLDDVIVIGPGGYAAYSAAHGPTTLSARSEGRFFAVVDRGDHYAAFCDRMGQDCIYYYTDTDLTERTSAERWTISNSFLALAEHLSQRGKAVLYRPPLAGFHITKGTGIGSQLLSHNTPLKHVKVLPIGCELRISKNTNRLELARLCSSSDVISENVPDIREAMRRYLIKWASRLHSISNCADIDTCCDLSGGHDSRAVLGMLIASGCDARRIRVVSNPQRQQDHEAARIVGATLGIPLTTRADFAPSLSTAESYVSWKYGSTGVYLPVYPPRLRPSDPCIRFHGGNFLSKEFGEHSAESVADSFATSVPSHLLTEVKEEFLASFDQLALSGPFAMQMHYINQRCRFHYGRNWCSITPVLTPLIDYELASIAFKRSPEEYNKLEPALDLLLAIDYRLAVLPFDLPEKSFSAEQLLRSPFFGHSFRFDDKDLTSYQIYLTKESQTTSSPMTRTDFLELFRQDFRKNKTAACDTGLFSKKQIENADRLANEPSEKNLSRNLRLPTHFMFAGILNTLAN